MVCAYLISDLIMYFSDLEIVEEAMGMVFVIYCASINNTELIL